MGLLSYVLSVVDRNVVMWRINIKVKVAFYGAFSTLRPFDLLYSYPRQVPAFISRGATHHTDARELYQLRREL